MTASSYQEWLATCETELFCPKEEVADRIAALAWRPYLSILLPTFNSNLDFLDRCIRSVQQQHYPHWQLCVADDGSSDARVVEYLRTLSDPRVALQLSERNSGISAASNLALGMAEGEFILLLDHDDELHEHALLEVATVANLHPDADLIYSDEDKIDLEGHRVCPAFKPDFDPDIFLSFDYLGHLIALRRRIANEVGGFRSDCNGAQDWDLLVRALERIGPDRVRHIPKPLYHWRMHSDSTAFDLDAKPYVRLAWAKVLAGHLHRTKGEAEIERGLFYGTMRLKHSVPRQAKVAVFLRTEDGAYQKSVLMPNVELHRTTFYELLGSSITTGEPGQEKWIWSLEEISAEVLIFINRPLETVNHGFFEELVAQSSRPDCGLVTGLSVDISRVIHSGFVRDRENRLFDPFAGLRFPQDGYLGQLSVPRQVEAISDEFFAIRREHLEAVGGLGSVSASFMPCIVQRLTQHARARNLRVQVTPYAIATFEGVRETHPLDPSSEQTEGHVGLNPNLLVFSNPAEVFRGNL